MNGLEDLALKVARERGIGVDVVMLDFLHFWVLDYMSKVEGIVLKGGGALRFFYDNPRYSCDLDFSCSAEFERGKDKLLGLCGWLQSKLGYSCRILKDRDTGFMKIIKYGVETGLGKLVFVLEFSRVRDCTRRLLIKGTPFPGLELFLYVRGEEEILIDKILAIAYRQKFQWRDVWDFFYLSRKGIKFDLDILKMKIASLKPRFRGISLSNLQCEFLSQMKSFCSVSHSENEFNLLPLRFRKIFLRNLEEVLYEANRVIEKIAEVTQKDTFDK